LDFETQELKSQLLLQHAASIVGQFPTTDLGTHRSTRREQVEFGRMSIRPYWSFGAPALADEDGFHIKTR